MKLFGIVLLVVGMSAVAQAGAGAWAPAAVPEIDPGSVVRAVALLSGGLLLVKIRRKKQAIRTNSTDTPLSDRAGRRSLLSRD